MAPDIASSLLWTPFLVSIPLLSHSHFSLPCACQRAAALFGHYRRASKAYVTATTHLRTELSSRDVKRRRLSEVCSVQAVQWSERPLPTHTTSQRINNIITRNRVKDFTMPPKVFPVYQGTQTSAFPASLPPYIGAVLVRAWHLPSPSLPGQLD